MKICTKCKEDKDEAEFSKKRGGLQPKCKVCCAEYMKAYWSDESRRNKKDIKTKEYSQSLEGRKKQKEYRERPEIKQRKKAYQSAYYKNYRSRPEIKKRRVELDANYLASNPLAKLAKDLRGLIWHAIAKQGYSKKSKTYRIVGMDLKTLNNWLEYTWFLNYGTEYIGQPVHIDHVVPCSSAKTEEELLALQHWTNLQYLTPKDNLIKSDN